MKYKGAHFCGPNARIGKCQMAIRVYFIVSRLLTLIEYECLLLANAYRLMRVDINVYCRDISRRFQKTPQWTLSFLYR